MAAKTPSISIFGLGYVGSVTAACFAHRGHRVIGVDTNPSKVEKLGAGQTPIVEAQMERLVAEGHRACLLQATTDAIAAVCESDISFISVGTPSQRNAKLDLRHVENVCQGIGQGIKRKNSHHGVVVRSTVLPGTTELVVIPALEAASAKRAGSDFGVCYNPEFLREGSAVEDFFNPPYTILGGRDPADLETLRELYDWVPGRVFETSLSVAEMVKYASNAFHALKVSFANEVGTLSKPLGVDIQALMEIFTSDTKLNISAAYLAPGFAFGGSCLPKDLRALTYRAKELDLRLPLLESILPSNQEHSQRGVELILATKKKKIGVLGLSFKAGTDDLRESPQVELIKRLLGEGCQIRVWDEDVSLGRLVGSNQQYIAEVIPHIASLLESDLKRLFENAEVVVIATRSLQKERIAAYLRRDQIVIDLANPEKARRVDGAAAYEGICW
jgi:GDP-mannose 6-dehydrogenase